MKITYGKKALEAIDDASPAVKKAFFNSSRPPF
jgi:hypothetical protein